MISSRRTISVLAASAVAALLGGACALSGEPGSAGDGAAARPTIGPEDIDFRADEPCRGPEFPGCEVCCTQAEAGRCVVREWTGSETSGVIPWYNGTSFQEVDCPADCRPCATCLSRYERERAEMGLRPDCDCATMPFVVDACIGPSSCACYCQRAQFYQSACPEL